MMWDVKLLLCVSTFNCCPSQCRAFLCFSLCAQICINKDWIAQYLLLILTFLLISLCRVLRPCASFRAHKEVLLFFCFVSYRDVKSVNVNYTTHLYTLYLFCLTFYFLNWWFYIPGFDNRSRWILRIGKKLIGLLKCILWSWNIINKI